MTTSPQNAAYFKPDFKVETPECLKDILDAHFSERKTYRPTRALRFILMMLARLNTGRLDVTLPNGKIITFHGKHDGPHCVVNIHDDVVARRFLTKGMLGFCEAYLDEQWSSPDIAGFFELMLINGDQMRQELLGKKWARALAHIIHKLQPNTRRGSRKNIYQHYDIGNDFYAAWLDPSMTYSSAYFADGIHDLEQAQARKYEEMVRRLDLKAEHHVLEIGCGWGGFAEYAARTVGCRMTCVTVSEAQHKYATNRIKRLGLQDKVDIRLQDYRDINENFDRIASIEMFEAVGESYWPVYFGTIKKNLKLGGRAVLQIITIRDQDFETYRKNADYIQLYIFPGGMLPSIAALDKEVAKAGLTKTDTLSFGADYARTLQIWNENFQAAWPALSHKDNMDQRFKRMWEQYLCYCDAGFRTGHIDVVQLSLEHDA